ncbi:hypothetical protein HYDPIDRAFT_27996 [Hydnomerulius pinastri MD-312]|uniref:Uncharacterized protein n=1 Tax=Hydnomerulius pinastri MD-312 TaxID=994086 RepID=A0A0C9W2L6_9AGAM|nr:hypothetical protein HYDPIDRAFT_27996 [Hydnomerulius pinastri MD-312]
MSPRKHVICGWLEKFALEGLTEALAAELDPKWNIKITIIAPGPFKTEGIFESGTVELVHPAYTDESLRSWAQHGMATSGIVNGDTTIAVTVMEKLVHLEDLPVHLPLHKLSINFAKQKVEQVLKETDAYESWSDDVYLD